MGDVGLISVNAFNTGRQGVEKSGRNNILTREGKGRASLELGSCMLRIFQLG